MPRPCKAITQRQALIRGIRHARGEYNMVCEGTEEELMNDFAILRGIVTEYQDGGDQMVEECDCGEHNDPDKLMKEMES